MVQSSSVYLILPIESDRASADNIILNLYIAFLFLGILKHITSDRPKITQVCAVLKTQLLSIRLTGSQVNSTLHVLYAS